MDERYQETFESWNKLASLYQEKFMNLDLYNETYDYFCSSLVQQNANLLEIGCGPGNITKYLLSKQPKFNILGLDVAPNMVELAKMNNPSAYFEVLDCRNIHQLDTKFHGIIAGFCLPYLSHLDTHNFISHSYNLLNENGIFYISFVEGNPSESAFQTASSGDRTFFYFYKKEEMLHQLALNNFHPIKVFEVDYRKANNTSEKHIIILAKKEKNNLQVSQY